MTAESPEPTPQLARLGDDIERAAAGQLAQRRRRGRTLRAAAGLAVAALLLTGTAAVAGLFTPKQVAAGMPAGAVIFGTTDPVCVLDADGATYHCTLASPPQSDDLGVTMPPAKAVVPTAMDYLDAKELLGIGGEVAGGCIGRSSDGLAWDCYIGKDAVGQEILTEDLLGEPMTEPGRG